MDHLRTRRGEDAERGIVMVWFAIILVVLLLVSAFTVDLVYMYSNAQEAQNAADAAATAGVVHRPNFNDAEARALAVGRENLTDAPACGGGLGSCVQAFPNDAGGAPLLTNQLRVEVTKRFNPIFAQFVPGITELSVTRSATAEYDPPIELGSPLNTFGRQVGCTGGPLACPAVDAAWASIAGPLTSKRNGNAATSNWCDDQAWGDNGSQPGLQYQTAGGTNDDNCVGSPRRNSDYEGSTTKSVQYFAIEKGAGPAQVEIFDPQWINVERRCKRSDPYPLATPQGDFVEFITAATTGSGKLGLSPADVRLVSGNATTGAGPPSKWCTGDNMVRFDMKYQGTGLPPIPQTADLCFDSTFDREPFFDCMTIEQVDKAVEDLQLEMDTTYTLLNSDGTPLDPTDNSDEICSALWHGYADIDKAYAADNSLNGWREWESLSNGSDGTGSPCTLPSAPGKYWLKVEATNQGQNQFSIAVSGTGNRFNDPNVSVTAFQRFAFFVNEADGGGTFFLARVLPAAVDRTLQISFFDIADLASGTNLKILPPDEATSRATGLAMDDFTSCRYNRPPGASSGPKPWSFGAQYSNPDDPLTGGQDTDPLCTIGGMTQSVFNSQWVVINVDVPADYDCDTTLRTGCWLRVQLQNTGSLVDVSTWSAQFPGGPVRITN